MHSEASVARLLIQEIQTAKILAKIMGEEEEEKEKQKQRKKAKERKT